MAGRHLDAAAAGRVFLGLGAAFFSIAATCRQIWPSSPLSPMNVDQQLASRALFRPGGLSNRGMTNYGDFLLQAASPVCAEPQSTIADYLFHLFINNTHCSPSEVFIPYDSARFFKEMAELGFDKIFSCSIRILLDLLTSIFPLVESSLSNKMVYLWIIMFLGFFFLAYQIVHDFLTTWILFFLSLVGQWLKSTFVRFAISKYEPYILESLHDMPFSVPLVPRDLSKRAIIPLCDSMASVVLEFTGQLLFAIWRHVSKCPMVPNILKAAATPTALDERLHHLRLTLFLSVPALPRQHRSIAAFALVQLIAREEFCALVPRLVFNRLPVIMFLEALSIPEYHLLAGLLGMWLLLSATWLLWKFGVVKTLRRRASWR